MISNHLGSKANSQEAKDINCTKCEKETNQ